MTTQEDLQQQVRTIAELVPDASIVFVGGVPPMKETLVVVPEEADRTEAGFKLGLAPPTTFPIRLITAEELARLQSIPQFVREISEPVPAFPSGSREESPDPEQPQPMSTEGVTFRPGGSALQSNRRELQTELRAELFEAQRAIGAAFLDMSGIAGRARALALTWPEGNEHRVEWDRFATELGNIADDIGALERRVPPLMIPAINPNHQGGSAYS